MLLLLLSITFLITLVASITFVVGIVVVAVAAVVIIIVLVFLLSSIRFPFVHSGLNNNRIKRSLGSQRTSANYNGFNPLIDDVLFIGSKIFVPFLCLLRQ